jgi:ERCC4 domain
VLDDLLVARNPDASSSLPYLIRVPLGPEGIVVKARETWPRTSKVYCHRAEEWPADAEIVERHAVRSCVRRGPAIDLVLDRARENRSQLVLTRARGREVIFWQSPRTARQARPAVALPTARAHGRVLDIVVDSGEKYPYTFRRQQATTSRRRLPAGDYAVEAAGRVVAAVERKTLEDLAGSLLSGRLTYALAELAALPRAAVVVEDRYSRLFKLSHVSGTAVAEALAEAQARFPSVPVTFCETRALAEEWTYRWLGACLAEIGDAEATAELEQTFAPGRPVPPPAPSARAVCTWARSQGIEVSDRERVPADLLRAYAEAEEATP